MDNTMYPETDPLEIDFSDLEIESIEVLLQEGAKGMPDFAASTGGSCSVSCASSYGAGCN